MSLAWSVCAHGHISARPGRWKSKASRANRAPEGDCVPCLEPLDPEDEKEAKARLEEQSRTLVAPFWKEKYEREAKANWDKFYKRNETNFFKDRHYLQRLFTELTECEALARSDPSRERPVLMEAGCGVGNTLFPLLEDYPSLSVIAFDFSIRAVEFVKRRPEFDPSRVTAFVCDIAKDPIPLPFDTAAAHFVTLMFVLSAVAPENHVAVLSKIHQALKPSGVLYIRDYAEYDMTELRFKEGAKIADHYYVRWDGTTSFFFSRAGLQASLEQAGFDVIENVYYRKVVRNVKRGLEMKRVWIFTKAIRRPSQ